MFQKLCDIARSLAIFNEFSQNFQCFWSFLKQTNSFWLIQATSAQTSPKYCPKLAQFCPNWLVTSKLHRIRTQFHRNNPELVGDADSRDDFSKKLFRNGRKINFVSKFTESLHINRFLNNNYMCCCVVEVEFQSLWCDRCFHDLESSCVLIIIVFAMFLRGRPLSKVL